MASENSVYIYRLTFGNTITNPTKDLTPLRLEQGVRREFTESISGNSDQEFYLMLQGVKVNRKIYQPTEIEAELVFMEKTTDTSGTSGMKAPSFKNVSALFLNRQVTVDILQVDRMTNTTRTLDYDYEYNIAKNCYVYELNPLLKHEVNGTKMYVKMNIFSMDKLMTLNKYSKAYVARKLGSGILTPESLEFGTFSADVPLVQTSSDGQQFLQYKENDTSYEFIQPYLVQYNESFYDFLVRTSNRCGEFLYFENGKLTLGLPSENFKATEYEIPNEDPTKAPTKGPLNITDYESVTMQSVSADPLDISAYARDSVKDGTGEISSLNQTVIKKNDAGYPIEAFPEQMSSNSEVATDEYIFPLFKDMFSTWKREMYYYGDGNDIAMFQAFKAGKTIFGNTLDTYGGIVASLAIATIVDHGIQMYLSNNQANSFNKDKNEAFIDSMNGKTEQIKGDKVVQFASQVAAGWTTVNYYNDIFKNEEAQQRQIICINMGTNYVDIRLGQKITVEGLDGNYVVIQVQQISEEAWNRDYEKYGTQVDDKYAGKRSMKIYAIPSYKNKNSVECFIPPVHPVPVIRKVGPQTAFVTANEDPKFQGRVRIAYPWQSEGSGAKAELAEAESKLAAAQAKIDDLTQKKNDWVAKQQELHDDVETLKKYVNATPEKRDEMIKDKENDISTLQQEIDTKNTDKKKKETHLEEEEKKDPKNEVLIEQDKREIKELDSQIAERKAKKEHINQLIADMKAAAEEHDKRNGTDSTYKKIEKHNSVINKYRSGYSQQLREALANLERAENEKEAASEACKQAATAVKQKIEQMSTPWVRIATPMATPGGGTFFRPRVGDEVLVNYDCDNVERPYVVGSFFSKNTLTPDERYYRKQSPELQWKNVSMAISSPNGHHISFTDPEYGGSFITNLISPGLGFYGGVLGFNNFAGGGKDLAGGIHIGDRYGLYEIEMKSHKRAIDIKSPFGTVNINAFTGITISAPNGDVTIKGKNITLEAGNKITLNSGTNLPQPGCGEQPTTSTKVADITKLIIEGVGNAVTSQFASSIVDLSTIRHIIEVFVRPVDGTTLIKSRKFLRLEAGLGNATIKRNKYKESAETSQEIEQEFYKALCERVKFINDQLGVFLSSYETLRNNFYSSRSQYMNIMKRLFADDKQNNIPNMAKKAKDKVASNDATYDFTMDEYNSLVKDHVKPTLAYKETNYTSDEQKYNLVKPVLMAYYKAAYDLQNHCKPERFKLYLVYDEGGDYEWLTKAMKDTAEGGWISQQVNKWQGVFDTDMEDSSIYYNNPKDPYSASNSKFFRRSFLLLYLKKVYDSPENKVKELPEASNFFGKFKNAVKEANTNYKYIYIGYKEADVTNPENVDLNVDYWWKRQVKVIDRWSQNSWLRAIWDGTAKNLIGAFLDNTKGMWKKETDRQVWNSDLNGQILFSDREDSTLSFEGEGLHKETDANQGNIEHLKWILRDM